MVSQEEGEARVSGEISDNGATFDSGHSKLLRFDILTNSRLSQLFELSANLEAVAKAANGSSNERKVQSPWAMVDMYGGEGGSRGELDSMTAPTLSRYGTPNSASHSSNASLDIKVSYMTNQILQSCNALIRFSIFQPNPVDHAFPSKGVDIILSPATRGHSAGSDLSNSSPAAESLPKSTERQTSSTDAMESDTFDLVVKMATEAANNAVCLSGRVREPDTSATEALWQGRCMELEESLEKFRDQAQNIRELLREKVRLS